MEPVIQYALVFGILGAVWSLAWAERLVFTAHVIAHALNEDGGTPVTLGQVIPHAALAWLGAASIQMVVTLLVVSFLMHWVWVVILMMATWFMGPLAVSQLPAGGGPYFRRQVVKDMERRLMGARRRGCRVETEQMSAMVKRIRAIKEGDICVWRRA